MLWPLLDGFVCYLGSRQQAALQPSRAIPARERSNGTAILSSGTATRGTDRGAQIEDPATGCARGSDRPAFPTRCGKASFVIPRRHGAAAILMRLSAAPCRCVWHFVGALALLLASCTDSARVSLDDIADRVYTRSETIDFADRCADEQPHMRTALALFDDSEGRAHALAVVYAGRLGINRLAVREEAGVSLWLDNFHSRDMFPDASGHTRLALALGEVRGMDAPGPVRGADGEFSYYGFDDPHRTARIEKELALRISDFPTLGTSSRLKLIVRSASTEDTLTLEGPLVKTSDLELAAKLPPVTTRSLSLLQTLNPVQEGGLLHTLARGARYDICRITRTAARGRFDDLARAGAIEQAWR